MFKLLKLYRFFVPNLTVISMGGGSSTSAATLTPEQKELLQLQTGQLRDVFMPAYTSTVQGAKDTYNTLSPFANQAALNTFNTATDVGGTQRGIAADLASGARAVGGAGAGGTLNAAQFLNTGGQNIAAIGAKNLESLFSPNYKTEQIQAALQPAREAARESQVGQNAMYGAAGGLGSSRMALADRNLYSLNQQRMQSAAAQTSAAVEAQRQQAAITLLGTGAQSISTAGNLYGGMMNTGFGAGTAAGNLYGQSVDTTGKAITAAQSPMDLYNKYAGVVFGTPQASTVPNFAGTQGSTSSGMGFNFGMGQGSDISIKENIQKIGSLNNGINLYKFEYKDQYKDTWGHGQQVGVMAQEVEKVIPEAVSIHKDGYKLVNYSMVM